MDIQFFLCSYFFTLQPPCIFFFFEMVSGYLLVDGLFQSALRSFDILESDGTSWNSKLIIPKADKKLE